MRREREREKRGRKERDPPVTERERQITGGWVGDGSGSMGGFVGGGQGRIQDLRSGGAKILNINSTKDLSTNMLYDMSLANYKDSS